MAFPSIQGLSVGTTTVGVQNHVVTLPLDIQVGELLVIHSNHSAIGGLTPSENFLQVGTNGALTAAFAKIADGTEGADVAFTTSANSSSLWIASRISGASGLLARSTEATSLDPPSLTSGFGAKDVLWLPFAFSANGASTLTAPPTNYTDLFTVQNVGNNFRGGIARRNLNAATEDAGAFTGGGGVLRSFMLAIEPAAAATFQAAWAQANQVIQ
jgi:hypothetical protein